jgi:hypothetical protein
MRVSETFNLGRTQGELDFVDVDVTRDTALFVDPAALRQLPGDWARDGVALVQDFFQAVIDAIKDGDNERAIRLLAGLREPNETHLGLSKGTSRGRALGPGTAEDIWEALEKSEATRTGLLVHLEDTALLVRGVGPDLVSDIATNLIRDLLIAYTNQMAEYYGIPLTKGVVSGPLWDPAASDWQAGRFVDLPVADEKRLLLVPKAIVRQQLEYDTDEYLHKFILPHLEFREISANTELVRTIKYNGAKKVAKKDLIAKYGGKKDDIIRVTLEQAAHDTDLLARYRETKEKKPGPPPSVAEMASVTDSAIPDWNQLLAKVKAVTAGTDGATDYHNAVERLLTAVFSPSLAMPFKEYKILQGRKRIDIAYVNADTTGGFFWWVAQHHPAPNVFVECKNYKGDLANAELDQIAGRFSPNRGKLGLLCCRSFKDKNLFVQRCRDTALDGKGFIIVLDDDDLSKITELRKANQGTALFQFLKARFDELV